MPNGRLRKHRDNLNTIALGQTVIAALPAGHSIFAAAPCQQRRRRPRRTFLRRPAGRLRRYDHLARGRRPDAGRGGALSADTSPNFRYCPDCRAARHSARHLADGAESSGPYSLEKWLSIGQLAALAAFLLWAVGRALTSRRITPPTPHPAEGQASGGMVSEPSGFHRSVRGAGSLLTVFNSASGWHLSRRVRPALGPESCCTPSAPRCCCCRSPWCCPSSRSAPSG